MSDLPHPPVTVLAVPYEDAGRFADGLALDRFERGYVGDQQLRLYRFYGATFWLALADGGEPVSLAVARAGKSGRKNAWGRYVNHYLAYTAPPWRRQGYATATETALRRRWRDDGYDRVKTLCQSWLGFAYHEHMRDRVWGLNPAGELVIDSPLHPGPWPDGVPIKARQHAWHDDRELSYDELVYVMTDPAGRYRRTPQEVKAVLDKRPYRC